MFGKRRRSTTDFKEEIRSHIELETERLIYEGMTAEDARVTAHRVFGNATAAEERFYERNRTIYFEGDDADSCFRVRSGTVRLCKVTEDGRRQIAAFLTAGDLFGWAEGSAYVFSAEAVTDVTVEKFQRCRVDRAAMEDPAMGHRILAIVARQLACARQHVVLLGRMTACERIATFLLDLARRQRRPGADDRTIELAMNRRDLADARPHTGCGTYQRCG